MNVIRTSFGMCVQQMKIETFFQNLLMVVLVLD